MEIGFVDGRDDDVEDGEPNDATDGVAPSCASIGGTSCIPCTSVKSRLVVGSAVNGVGARCEFVLPLCV